MRMVCAGAYPALQRTLYLDAFEPGVVHRIRKVHCGVAGKAVNAARVLLRLGAEPVVAGFTGGVVGQEIEQRLAVEGLDGSGLLRVAASSRICQTILPGDESAFTELIEEGPALPARDWLRLISQCLDCIGRGAASGMLLAGTIPSHASLDFYPALLRAVSVPVLLDTSGPALAAALPARPDIVKINADELRMTCGGQGRTDKDIIQMAGQLLKKGARSVGVTQGGGDAFLVTPEKVWSFGIPDCRVVSALGSGDSVNAGMLFGMVQQQSLLDAFILGLACGVANTETAQPGDVDVERVQVWKKQIIVVPV